MAAARRLIVFAAALGLGLPTACVRELSSDERLERGTRGLTQRDPLDLEALERIRCNGTAEALAHARSDGTPETQRVVEYQRLYGQLRDDVATLDAALHRNPDLAYRESSEGLRTARDHCVRHLADVRLEFERFVRELVALPTVREIRGGATVTIARLDFPTLKGAIGALELSDREALVHRLELAERKVSTKGK